MAADCWVIFLTRMDSLALLPMSAVMMGAMMLPSTVPQVAGQSMRTSRLALVAGIYLAMWTVAGVPLLLLAGALPAATLPVVLVVVAAALAYGLTPVQRACRQRCLALCSEPAPPIRIGLSYGLNCIGCSAGVMAALAVIGPMSPPWMLLATAAIALYKMPGLPSSQALTR